MVVGTNRPSKPAQDTETRAVSFSGVRTAKSLVYKLALSEEYQK